MTSYKIYFGKIKIFLTAIIALLVLLALYFVLTYSLPALKDNKYTVQNSFYGFSLSTPGAWSALENTDYSEENIGKIMDNCKNQKTTAGNYMVGAFRFESNKLVGKSWENGFSFDNAPTGAILEILVECVPEPAPAKDDGFSNLIIGGEKAAEGSVASLAGFSTRKNYSFLHNGLEYKINEYIFVSKADEAAQKIIRADFEKEFTKIILSFTFLK